MRPPRNGSREGDLVAIAAAAVVLPLSTGAWAAWWLAHQFSGAPPVPSNPISLTVDLAKGEVIWPSAATWWAAGLILVAALAAALIGGRLLRGRRVDRAARKLPRDRDGLRRYLTGDGPVIGRLVAGGRGTVRMTSEDQAVVIAGPRTGKTTRIAIPAALDHSGPLVITSNKRDICDAIHQPRAAAGRVWVFDPQNLAGRTADWWWNPLTACTTVTGARRLAGIWAHAGRDPGAKLDAYFEPEGEELLATLLLAAAHGGHPISRIYEWLTRHRDPEPGRILDEAAGCQLMADGLRARQDLPDKQRAGVWSTAAKIISWVADPEIRQWIEQRPGIDEFNATAFAASTDTLVSLSREGEGSASPLVTALTAAVLRSAEELAATRPTGRLEPTMLGVLDEAANVCRWRDLPDLYSHYGSRGIVLVSIFQSWAQMGEAFGRDGAEKLWSAANVRVYGGGVSDPTFLRRLSDLGGEHDATVWSTSTSRQGSSRSQSTQRRAVLDVATLGALPPGRALTLLSAARPVLVELVPWWDGPHAPVIRASIGAAS